MKKVKSNPKRLYPIERAPLRSKDLPATQGMLLLLRTEMKSEFRSQRAKTDTQFKKVDAKFKRIDARFNEMEARFDKVDARFNEMEGRFDKVDARFNEVHAKINDVAAAVQQVLVAVHQVAAQVAKIGISVEEQNSRNRITLEGHIGLAQRQDRIEARVDDVENQIRLLGKARKSN